MSNPCVFGTLIGIGQFIKSVNIIAFSSTLGRAGSLWLDSLVYLSWIRRGHLKKIPFWAPRSWLVNILSSRIFIGGLFGRLGFSDSTGLRWIFFERFSPVFPTIPAKCAPPELSKDGWSHTCNDKGGVGMRTPMWVGEAEGIVLLLHILAGRISFGSYHLKNFSILRFSCPAVCLIPSLVSFSIVARAPMPSQ